MAYLVWCADRETEHDGQFVHATTPEDAASGYVTGAVCRGKGFEDLARDGGSLVFCIKRGERVQRMRITAHFTRAVLAAGE
jgi:hypothetical protein